MRLIDADALAKDLCENYIFTGFSELLEDFASAIRAQPTVDAVPVEWIEQYKQSIGSQTLVGYRWIEKMQIAWAERKDDDSD